MGWLPGTFSRRKESQAPGPCSVEDSRTARSLGRAGFAIVPVQPFGGAKRFAQWPTGQSTGSALRESIPARREAAGVTSAWSQSLTILPRATTPMVRRRVANGGPAG